MAIIRLNSFWDYLGQGVKGAMESQAEVQRRKLLESQEERAKKMFEYQSAPYEMAEQIVNDKTPKSVFFPNILSNVGGQVVPLPGPFSDNQYALARAAVPGLESPTAKIRRERREATEDKIRDLSVPKAELGAREATALLPTVDATVRRQQVEQIRPMVTEFANAYVARQILEGGGKLTGGPKGNLATLAANAYGAFTADPQRISSLGIEGISSDTLRPLFDEAVKAAWDDQQKLDLETLRARAYMAGQGPADKTPQIMNALTNIAKQFEARVKAMNDNILDPGKLAMISAPESPEAKAFMAKVSAAQNTANTLMAASSALAAGTITIEQATKLLNDATAMIQGEASPQGEPQGGPPAQAFEDNAVVAEAMKYGPMRWRTWLNEGVRLGRISQEQAQRVLLLLERRKP